MSVQLLPFQKLVDIPDVAQRHRCAIRGLAITSIVLIWTLFALFVTSTILSGTVYFYISLLMFTTTGIPLMVILLFLVSISSAVALCNTDKWASADVCCNLMRSHPARCTRSCSGSKHRCARLSNTHIGASVLTSLVLVLYLAALFSDCGQAASNRAEYEHDMNKRSKSVSGSRSNDYYGWRHTTTTRRYHNYYDDRRYNYSPTSCGATATFEIIAIILLISLVATTARSAYLLRQIEQAMPEVAVLPPGKMVTQADELVPFVPHPIDNGNDEKPESTDGTIVLSTPV